MFRPAKKGQWAEYTQQYTLSEDTLALTGGSGKDVTGIFKKQQ
jgi:hypothetical protein